MYKYASVKEFWAIVCRTWEIDITTWPIIRSMPSTKNHWSILVVLASPDHTKGQIMSECIDEIIDFPKYHRKNLIDFCPGRFYRLGTCDLFWLFSRRLYSGECITYLVWINFQGRNLSIFFSGILENRWFHKYILISSDL